MAIRAATEGDIPAMLEIYRPYVEHTTYSFEYTLPSREEFTRRFREHTRQFPWLVWEQDGRVLGYAYAGSPWERAAYRWCAEISIYLHESVHGRGIGRALYGWIEDCLQSQGYRLVYALITSENTGSVAFHQQLGYHLRANFENCGYKFGRWLGVLWLEKQLSPLGDPEGFPKPWREVN
jgi:phosphinothricin acetyltransferase